MCIGNQGAPWYGTRVSGRTNQGLRSAPLTLLRATHHVQQHLQPAASNLTLHVQKDARSRGHKIPLALCMTGAAAGSRLDTLSRAIRRQRSPFAAGFRDMMCLCPVANMSMKFAPRTQDGDRFFDLDDDHVTSHTCLRWRYTF